MKIPPETGERLLSPPTSMTLLTTFWTIESSGRKKRSGGARRKARVGRARRFPRQSQKRRRGSSEPPPKPRGAGTADSPGGDARCVACGVGRVSTMRGSTECDACQRVWPHYR